MGRQGRYPAHVRERAVCLVFEQQFVPLILCKLAVCRLWLQQKYGVRLDDFRPAAR